jgi:hypothetical protein
LTERGQQLVDERRARYEGRWRAALSAFGDDELRAAAAVLDGLAQLFTDLDSELGR